MESWTEELENKLIELNNELTCLALTGCVPLNARRRSASCVVEALEGVQSDSTHNSTQLDVELSCVAINGALVLMYTLDVTLRIHSCFYLIISNSAQCAACVYCFSELTLERYEVEMKYKWLHC